VARTGLRSEGAGPLYQAAENSVRSANSRLNRSLAEERQRTGWGPRGRLALRNPASPARDGMSTAWQGTCGGLSRSCRCGRGAAWPLIGGRAGVRPKCLESSRFRLALPSRRRWPPAGGLAENDRTASGVFSKPSPRMIAGAALATAERSKTGSACCSRPDAGGGSLATHGRGARRRTVTQSPCIHLSGTAFQQQVTECWRALGRGGGRKSARDGFPHAGRGMRPISGC